MKNVEQLKELIAETVKDNIPQGKAIKAIFTSRQHIFITGKAGAGKTYFLKKIMPFIENCAIVAPTGIAAMNAGGVTMHSFFRLPISPYVPKIKDGKLSKNFNASGDPNFKKNMKKLDTLIIDEISMVRADVLDRISDVLCQTRKKDVPFGGVRLIMIGDLNQLPPVVTGSEIPIIEEYYESPYFFSSKALKASGFMMTEFDKVYRQSDPVFINLLNNIRKGNITEDDQNVLNSRYIPIPDDFNGIRICSHNNIAQSINDSMLKQLSGDVYELHANVSGIPPKNVQCEEVLCLKKGCQVIMTKNQPEEYVNGSSGIVMDINEEDDVISVKINETGKTVLVFRNEWDNIEYTVCNGSISETVLGRISQFPMKLGYAISSHKSQGMTFDQVLIDVQRAFTNGQAYVALSRCRTLDGTYLASPITNKQLIQDSRLIDFYRKSEAVDGVFEPEDLSKEQNKTINFEDFGL